MSHPVHQAIRQLLVANRVSFEEIAHRPVFTAREAAEARGCPTEIGAKSIVLKTDDVFRLFVLSGASSLRSRLIRKQLGVRRTRFATAEELLRIAGVEPGAVPPFGEPVLPLEIYADPGLLRHERIAFTPGVHTASIMMRSQDWKVIARPTVFPLVSSESHEAIS